MFDRVTEVNILFDFYSQLLTEKQREVVRLYRCENFSLSEIGQEFSISRQGVYDALKNAERALAEYEEKLGLVSKFKYASILMKNAESDIDAMISENTGNKILTDKLYGLKDIIGELSQ